MGRRIMVSHFQISGAIEDAWHLPGKAWTPPEGAEERKAAALVAIAGLIFDELRCNAERSAGLISLDVVDMIVRQRSMSEAESI